MSETSIDLDVLLGSARTEDDLALNVIRVLLRRWDDLVEVLTLIASRPAAHDELRRSIATLAGASWELERHRPRTVSEVAVFLPSNNVLYSYILFGVIPAAFTGQVVMRPSARVADVTRAVHLILSTDPLLAGRLPIEFAELSQRNFLVRCATADAVVFTGRPENAEAVARRLAPDTLLLAFGSGPNPVVAGPQADLPKLIADVVRARTYNSGQDCLCPDVVFAHESVADDLVSGLDEAITRLSVGARTDFGVDVAPLAYDDAVHEIGLFLDKHQDAVRTGGLVDEERGLVQPTLLELRWDPGFHPPEFFGPVFCVMRYRDVADLRRWAKDPVELRRGMYLSRYGEDALTEDVFGTAVVLRDEITLDIENGNAPLGGFGVEASHVRNGRMTVARPLLLSAELGVGGLADTAPAR
ncbi:aldehyde dehydrogenase family protein [Amycolatopsis sp. NPDC059657]|uniref:aldehyde dehydrogenase family protein n=1 Tax=Amycolatopsis sp. NPDC059657 TaxID=3346899 RepID=UPI00366C2DE2